MRKALILLGLVTIIVLGFSVVSQATVVTFDNISGNAQVTNQYASQGINFTQTYELDTWNTGYAPIKYAGDHIAFSSSNSSSIFYFDNSINNFSLLVTASNHNLYLQAYDASNTLLKTSSSYIPIGAWYTMSMDLSSTPARKIIIHDNGNQFAFDNLTFNSGAVPEPASMSLLGLGLLGAMAGLRRKKLA